MKFYLWLTLLFLLLPALAIGAPNGPLVLFDEGHGERFHIDREGELDLSLLAGAVRAKGGRAEALGHITPTLLAGADALVISGPFHPLTEAEQAILLDFLEHGGRLAIMLHIAPPISPLLARLGIVHSNGVVRETGPVLNQEPLNFLVRDLAPHPLFAGIEQFAVFGAWALNAEGDAAIIARSGAKAWVDLNRDGEQGARDAVAAFGLAAAGKRGQGEFVVFGDDAIFQNRTVRDYNSALASHLAGWLTGEGKVRP